MWLYESVLYQIYPIGFCGAPRINDGFVGNEILKVIDWIPHFKSLGVDCVLFNPIFDSDSHGYDTRDFKQIDKRLGTNADFKKVCKELKENGIRIVLDGVFNHVGRGFWAFKDVQEKRENSPYVSWFNINFGGNSNYNDGFWYEGWEGHFELVELNLNNPDVVNHLLEAVKIWIEDFGIDGLRLDVAYSLKHDFMRNLRNFCTNLKPDFALIGEVLFGDYNIIVNDEMLHSCTNYECYKGLFSSMNDNNLFEISHSLHRQFGKENWCIYHRKHLMTFVDNHDVTRISTILKDKRNLPLVYSILFSMPGVPCVYYGSEWGEEGDKNSEGDWLLRPCFEEPKPNELTKLLAKMIEFRKTSPAFNYGDYENIVVQNKQLCFKRDYNNNAVFALINIDENPYTFNHHELSGTFFDPINEKDVAISGNITLEPFSFVYLKRV